MPIISLLSLSFLATVDMAFSRFSDVSLRRIVADAEEGKQQRAAALLREIIENRPRFRFAISSTIQILLIVFTVFSTLLVARYTDNGTTLISSPSLSGSPPP